MSDGCEGYIYNGVLGVLCFRSCGCCRLLLLAGRGDPLMLLDAVTMHVSQAPPGVNAWGYFSELRRRNRDLHRFHMLVQFTQVVWLEYGKE